MKEAIRITQQPSFQKLGLEVYTPPLPTCPGIYPGSDDYWRCWASTISATLHHQVATCKMGFEVDPTTVVDHTLTVHGFSNLRVVDIGIIPQPPSGHTNAYAFMIGERASDLIKDRWNTGPVDVAVESFGQNDLFHYYLNYKPVSPHRFGHRFKRSHFDWQLSSDEKHVAKKEAETEKAPDSDKVLSNHRHESSDRVMLPEKRKAEMDRFSANSHAEEISDLKLILRPSPDDISKRPPAVIPLTSPPPPGLEEILDAVPSVDEDDIRTVDLDKKSGFNHGKNKPKEITEALTKINTTHFEKKDFPESKETKFVHLHVKGEKAKDDHDRHPVSSDKHHKDASSALSSASTTTKSPETSTRKSVVISTEEKIEKVLNIYESIS